MSIVHRRADAALDLLARSLQPVRLHGLRDDGRTCTCRLGAACKVAGKHPTDTGWQDAPMPTPEQIVADWSGWRARCNVGVKTGASSGVWVLDVDPDNGGDLTLAALEARHGALPRTYTVRTGSGGRHPYFQLPDFSLGNSAGRLGKGLDIRAEGGQAVAPPSVTAKGAYTVLDDAPVAAAPPGCSTGCASPPPRRRNPRVDAVVASRCAACSRSCRSSWTPPRVTATHDCSGPPAAWPRSSRTAA